MKKRNHIFFQIIFLITLFTQISKVLADENESPAKPSINYGGAPVNDPGNSTTQASSSPPDASSMIPGGVAENANIPTSVGMSKLANLVCSFSASYSTNVAESCKTLKTSAESCSGKYDLAAPICRTESNPNLLSTISQIQALMGAAQGMMDSCSGMGKAMDIAKMGMAAYAMACGAAKKVCDVSCAAAVADLKKYKQASKTANAQLTQCANSLNDLQQPSCNTDLSLLKASDELAEADTSTSGITVAAKEKNCQIDMSSLLSGAAINLASFAQSMAPAGKCEKDTKSANAAASDCTKPENKEKTECKTVSTVVDCGLTANADKPICICKANPRVTGCEGVSTALATNSTMSTGSDGTTSGRGANANLTGAPGAATDKKFPADLSKTNKNDGSGIGGGGGGGTAGLSANSGAGSSDGEKLEKAENAGNANILSNESGGGGGGYRFGLGGSSASKAQLRRLAGDNGFKGKLTAKDWTAQVTSNGGKSNFDKVKVRYIENRTSLLNR